MTDARTLFKSGKRYRGFAQVESIFTPVSFSVYTVDSKEVRLRYIFPPRVASKLQTGSVIYVLIEDKGYMIGELRITGEEKEGKALLASLDFVTKDRRKLPRVKVKGLVNLEAEVLCKGSKFQGLVVDISMSSVGVELKHSLPLEECDLYLKYRSQKIKLRAKVVKSDEEVTAFEILSNNGEITTLLSRVYADILIKVQRER